MVDYTNHKMSGSEDEPEAHIQTGMTKAELRRSNKPIMEKRRRARINQCLEELKSLILEAMKKDPTRHSKLEKADILEMTVKHLQAVQRQQLSTAVATNPAVLTKFRTGFTECASEVSRYVSHLENVDPVVKQRLVSHLNSCVSNLQQISPLFNRYMPYMPERLYSELKVGFHNDFQNGDENNNGSARIQIPNGVQLIPSRLPTGELALLVPQSAAISANFPFFPPASESTSTIGQSSAFTAVQRPQSPLLSPSTSTSSFGEESHQSEHYPRAQSPNHEPNFKIPEQSPASKSFRSSPETQKPQISSTSDSTSPVPIFMEHNVDRTYPTRKDFVMDSLDILNGAGIAANLRQPLSVITDKTYNQSSHVVATRSEATKRRYDGLLVISNKRARYPESISSTVPIDSSNGQPKSGDDQPLPEEDLSEGPTCSTNRNSNPNPLKFDAVAGPSGANADMWRPW